MFKFKKILFLIFVFLSIQGSVFAAGFKQVIVGGTSDTPAQGSTNYISPNGAAASQWNGTEANRYVPIPIATTISSLYVEQATACGAAKSRQYNILNGGSATNMPTATISGASATTANDTSTSTGSFTAGQTFSLQTVPTGNPATSVSRWSFISTPTTTGQGMLLGNSATNLATGATNYVALNGSGVSATETDVQLVMPFGGTLKNMYILLSGGTGGAGKKYTLSLRNVTTATDTSIVATCDNTASCSDLSHTQSVSAGDVYDLESVPSGTPTARFVGVGIELDPTTDGHFIVSAVGAGSMSTSATNYTWGGAGSGSWNATESNVYSLAQTMTVKAIYVQVPTGLGATGSYALTFMNNGSASALTCTVNGLLVKTCNAATNVSYSVDGGHFDTKEVPSGTPLGDAASVSYDCYNAPPATTTVPKRMLLGVGI